VRRGDRGEHRHPDVHRRPVVERDAGPLEGRQHHAERRALDELERDHEAPLGREQVHDLDDVRVRQPGVGARLVRDLGLEQALVALRRGQHLEHDPHARVVLREVHLAPARRRQPVDDAKAPDSLQSRC